jgi:hypothetical protein
MMQKSESESFSYCKYNSYVKNCNYMNYDN